MSGRGASVFAACVLAGLGLISLIVDSLSRSRPGSVLLSSGGMEGAVGLRRRGWRPLRDRFAGRVVRRSAAGWRQQLSLGPVVDEGSDQQAEDEEDGIFHAGLKDGHMDYAPSTGWQGVGFGYLYEDGLPPEEWPRNFDGDNFIDLRAAIGHNDVGEPHSYGDYWLAATGEDPHDWVPEDEESSNVFADLRWNDNAWCSAFMCDYTNEDLTEPVSGDFQPGVPYVPL